MQDSITESLAKLFSSGGLEVFWNNIDNYQLPEKNIDSLIEPFLGKDDPLWGTHYPFGMESFFDPVKISKLRIYSFGIKYVQQTKLILYGLLNL